ncbi:calcium-binding protein, partial [Mesorhizobium marinum]|uniref:calcium-binding protein n=1 Tax=Mesorhizobium marinum TaxID=3228790 RepID=UPI003467D6F9
NDAPVISSGPDTVDLDETDAALTATGTLIVSDVDTTDVVTASIDGVVVSGTSDRLDDVAPSDGELLAMLSITPAAILDGTENSDTLTWNFDSDTEAFDYLASGETLILTYTVKVTDDSGVNLSDTETVTITITGTNDAPVVTAGAALDYQWNDGLKVVDNTVTVSDVDDTQIESATVSITSGYVEGQDFLGFVNANGITGSFAAATGVLTLTGSATKATYEEALRSVTFTNIADDPTVGDRQISFAVSDGEDDSVVATSAVTVTPFNDIFGDEFVNALDGTAASDRIYGLDDNDQLLGNGGNDKLFGGDGDDQLFGGDGDDLLVGGEGVDQLTGGDGSDEFVFLAATDGSLEVDQILDYQSEDRINLDELLSPTFDPDTWNLEISLVDAGGGNSTLQVGGVDVAVLLGVDFSSDTVNVIFDQTEVVAISNIPSG